MELCKISSYSGYKKHYGDTIFVVLKYDGDMVNVKYRKFMDKSFTGITLPIHDIVVIQLGEKCPKCGGVLEVLRSGEKCNVCGYWDCS